MLSIGEGVEVLFDPGASLVVRGALIMQGTSTDIISIGSTSQGQEIIGITLNGPCSRGEFSYCGFNGFRRGIEASDVDTLLVSHCSFSSIIEEGIRMDFTKGEIDFSTFSFCGTGVRSYESELVFESCIFDSCSISGYRAFFSNDSLVNCTFSGNDPYGVYLDQGTAVINANDFSGNRDALVVRNGAAVVIDSSFFEGGNRGIYCHSDEVQIISNLFYDILDEAISCFGSSPLITSNDIDSCGTAIGCYDNAVPEIAGNTISDCLGYGIYCSDSSPVISGNNLLPGDEELVKCRKRTSAIMAEGNWWGDASGPEHPLYNPEGLGGSVGDFVSFTPWTDMPF